MTGSDGIETFRLVKAARRLFKPAIDCITSIAGRSQEDIACEAILALGRIGDPSSRELLVASPARFPDRQEPLAALGAFRDSTPVPRLIELLGNPDYQFKEDVVRVLGEIGDPQATEALKSLLYDNERMVRYYAAWALYKIGGRDVVQSLCALLSDADEWIVINVLEILSRLKDPEAVPALVGQFKIVRDPRLRAIIISSLAAFAEPRLLPVFEEGLNSFDPRIQANAVEAVAMLKISALEVRRKLKKFLGHPNNRVRANAIVALFRADGEKASTEVEAMMQSSDLPVRRSAAYVLAKVNLERRKEMIDKLLTDQAFGVRKMALRAALALKSDVGIGRILPLLQDGNQWVRKEAVDCIRKVDDAPIELLLETLGKESSPPVLESLLDFVVERHVEKAIPVILKKIREQPEEGLPKMLSSLGRLSAKKELLEAKKYLGDAGPDALREYQIAMLLHGELGVLSDIAAMLTEKKRDEESILWLKTAGEVGMFLRNPDLFSPRLTECLMIEARKDMGGVVEFGGSQAAAPMVSAPAQLSIETGIKLAEAGQYIEAEKFFRVFLGRFSDNAEALFHHGSVLLKLSRPTDALVPLERLRLIAPDHRPGAMLLGQIQFQQKNWVGLIETFEALRDRIPMSEKKSVSQVLGALGLGYFHQRRYTKAIEVLTKALAVNERDLSSSYHLALSYVAMKDNASALKLLRSLKGNLPPDSRVLRNVDELLQKLEEES
ncbi:MAG: HEAT repeat domain-containing protein [Candidatus Riflebacteria bacterium]|nr:HEAT repeat domain-containing protein [Candidatus Riflebacteria bacterium]